MMFREPLRFSRCDSRIPSLSQIHIERGAQSANSFVDFGLYFLLEIGKQFCHWYIEDNRVGQGSPERWQAVSLFVSRDLCPVHDAEQKSDLLLVQS